MKWIWVIILAGLVVLIAVTGIIGKVSEYTANTAAEERIQKLPSTLTGEDRATIETLIRLDESNKHQIHVGLWITVEVVLLLAVILSYFTFGSPPGKMLTVAQAAYRETVRQPLFWFLLIFSLFFLFLCTLIPYFTFRDDQNRMPEDLKMMKDVQLDALLLPALLLTVFTASLSISEEIEGRTAITLLSKPVSRRQFLIGKFLGILLAAILMALVLAVFMGWTIDFKISLDKLDRPGDPPEIVAMQQNLDFLPTVLLQAFRAILIVFAEVHALAPGMVLNFCQVMILTAVAAALATRLPMVVNLVACLVVFFMGRLTHVLAAKSEENALVNFVAKVFETILPGLNFYDIGPAIVAEVEVPWGDYVFHAMLHGLMYTGIALLFGLILFEDRDLA